MRLFCYKIVLLLSCLLVGVSFEFQAQFNFNYNDSINVFKNNQALSKAWGGGINYAQYSVLDIDYDGDEDLICFDRSADQIRVFKNENNSYKQLFDEGISFPNDVVYRCFFSDYNADGKNDLFTYGVGGIKVYKNVGDENVGLQWELSKDILTSDQWGLNLNIYVSSADIPAIVDVDNDNDLDVLTYHIGGEFLQYHKNLSQELYGHSDSLVFELKNECWGGFREDLNTNSVTLNDQSSPCQDGNIPNAEKNENEALKGHSGSTLVAFDYDGSGVKDLIIGDVSHQNLILLLNGGEDVNTNSQMISQDEFFPSNSTPVDMNMFPSAFYLDVDFDGVKDLVVCPNAKNVSENTKSCWKYKNTGNNSVHNFSLETKAFLQEEMIEHGTGSIPVFSDINNDGLEDLFVSSFYAYKPVLDKQSSIAFYQNTGSLNNPEFTFIDNDFLNLSANNYGLRLHPAFGDLNGDDKMDLLIGFEDGTLAYYENNSIGSSISFNTPVLNFSDNAGAIIDVGQYASPQLFDVNNDGLLDLLIGCKNGTMSYYRNIGSPSSPKFLLINNEIGFINVSENSPDGYSVPNLFIHNDSLFLIVGSFNGALYFFGQLTEEDFISGTIQSLNEDFLGLKNVIRKYSAPWINDINHDGNLELYVGQDLGGLFRLENDNISNLSVNEFSKDDLKIKIYPNPVKENLLIELSEEAEIQIFNSLGQQIFTKVKGSFFNIKTSNWSQGVYYVFVNGRKNQVLKFSKV